VAASADVVIAARWLGKGKTFATNLGIAILLLSFDAATEGPLARTGLGPVLQTAGAWTMVLATVMSVASGWDYVRGALPLLMGRSATRTDRPT
jgi:phosphatidylglycerophosphate synthase